MIEKKSEMGQAIERAAREINEWKGRTSLNMKSKIIHKHIDPLLTIDCELPVSTFKHPELGSMLNVSEDEAPRVAEFINRVARSDKAGENG
jgi:hypothetical protein